VELLALVVVVAGGVVGIGVRQGLCILLLLLAVGLVVFMGHRCSLSSTTTHMANPGNSSSRSSSCMEMELNSSSSSNLIGPSISRRRRGQADNSSSSMGARGGCSHLKQQQPQLAVLKPAIAAAGGVWKWIEQQPQPSAGASSSSMEGGGRGMQIYYVDRVAWASICSIYRF